MDTLLTILLIILHIVLILVAIVPAPFIIRSVKKGIREYFFGERYDFKLAIEGAAIWFELILLKVNSITAATVGLIAMICIFMVGVVFRLAEKKEKVALKSKIKNGRKYREFLDFLKNNLDKVTEIKWDSRSTPFIVSCARWEKPFIPAASEDESSVRWELKNGTLVGVFFRITKNERAWTWDEWEIIEKLVIEFFSHNKEFEIDRCNRRIRRLPQEKYVPPKLNEPY